MISFVENGIRTADDEYDEARELMESGQPALADRNEEALDICRRAAAANPDDDDLALRVIEIANALHRPELVADSARSYLKRFGRNAAVLSHLGNACLDLKEYRKAERAFRDAAALEPDVAGHHFNIVMLSILRGDEAGADAYLDKLASRDEELADAVKEADENL
jgi:Flp pilus assembly protein TadD